MSMMTVGLTLCRHATSVWNVEFHISLILFGFSSFYFQHYTLFPLKQSDNILASLAFHLGAEHQRHMCSEYLSVCFLAVKDSDYLMIKVQTLKVLEICQSFGSVTSSVEFTNLSLTTNDTLKFQPVCHGQFSTDTISLPLLSPSIGGLLAGPC